MIATLFQYSLSVSIPLIIMWASYHCIVAGEKQFALNRFVLLATYGVSLFLHPVLDWIMPAINVVYPISGESPGSLHATFDWKNLLAVIWAAGAIVTALFTIIEIIRIQLMTRRCERLIHNGHTIFITDNINQAPFSFARSIIINRCDYLHSGKEILAHEEGHLRLLHSYDMIMAQAVAILCWYNPAAWFMRSELKSVHEYQADHHALNLGLDARKYQLLLINKATGTKFPSIGNNFNNSKLKKRIFMINRPSVSSPYRKLLYLLPLGAIAVGALILTTPAVKGALSTRIVTAAPVKLKGSDRDLEDKKILIDGKETSLQDLGGIDPGSIKSITVSKDKNQIIVNTKNE